jgi:hypothetical protein
MEILRQHGMAYLGGIVLLPILAFIARGRSDARAVLALCVFPAAIAFVPPLATVLFAKGSYMVFRTSTPGVRRQRHRAGRSTPRQRCGGARRPRFSSPRGCWPSCGRRSTHRNAADAPRSHRLWALTRRLRDGAADRQRHPDRPGDGLRGSARTPHRFVAIFDQHANPYDPYAVDRLAAVRDALSPFVVPDRCVDACRRYGVDVVIVNAAAVGSAFVPVWDAALYRPTLERLRAIPSLREMNTAVLPRSFSIPWRHRRRTRIRRCPRSSSSPRASTVAS